MKALQDLTADDVLKVYSGKSGCMCGCRGKYWVNPAHQKLAGEERGYVVDDEDCSIIQVKRVLAVLRANADAVENDDSIGTPFYAVEIGRRTYVVYLAPGLALAGHQDEPGLDDAVATFEQAAAQLEAS